MWSKNVQSSFSSSSSSLFLYIVDYIIRYADYAIMIVEQEHDLHNLVDVVTVNSKPE